MGSVDFVDVSGRQIQPGDYIYHVASSGSSSWIERLLVIGFTKTMIQVVHPRHQVKYVRPPGIPANNYGGGTWEETDEWAKHTNIAPGRRIVVVNDPPWPEAEQYLAENGFYGG